MKVLLHILKLILSPSLEAQQEEAEWESINVLLMAHGLKPLFLVKRTDLKGNHILFLELLFPLKI
jgi:hypothetical protein